MLPLPFVQKLESLLDSDFPKAEQAPASTEQTTDSDEAAETTADDAGEKS
jgi:hypothetical protein